MTTDEKFLGVPAARFSRRLWIEFFPILGFVNRWHELTYGVAERGSLRGGSHENITIE